MVRVDRDIKKRWLLFALINLVLILLVFGSLISGFGVYISTEQQDAVRDGVRSYAVGIAALGVAEIKDMLGGSTSALYGSPEYYFALYTVTDGNVMIETADEFIDVNRPALGGRVGENRREEIAGHWFETYTASVIPPDGGSESAYYVKVFAPCDSLVAALDEISLYSIPFAIAFIVIAVVFSFVWGYIAIKPIMTDYIKQKDFINDMSHEIRTPLAVIKGNLENVLASPEAKVSEQAEMLYCKS